MFLLRKPSWIFPRIFNELRPGRLFHSTRLVLHRLQTVLDEELLSADPSAALSTFVLTLMGQTIFPGHKTESEYTWTFASVHLTTSG